MHKVSSFFTLPWHISNTISFSELYSAHPFFRLDDFEKHSMIPKLPSKSAPPSQWDDVLRSLSEIELTLITVMYTMETKGQVTSGSVEQVFASYKTTVIRELEGNPYDLEIVERVMRRMEECGVIGSHEGRDRIQRHYRLQLLPQQMRSIASVCQNTCPDQVVHWIRRQCNS